MGVGKSTVGKIVSEKLDLPFLDTDETISQRYKLTISEIFQQYGEEKFREYERKICQELSILSNLVIATGGGTLLDQENQKSLSKNGIIICLLAKPETIAKRLTMDHSRPLFNSNWQILLYKREPIYYSFVHQIQTDFLSPIEIADMAKNIYIFYK